MSDNWEIIYWENTEGGIEKWLDARTKDQLKGIAKELKLLERCGNLLRLPHSKALGQGLFELRERNYGYRIYYTFLSNKQILLLQAGDKSSQKNDVNTSRERLASLEKKRRIQ